MGLSVLARLQKGREKLESFWFEANSGPQQEFYLLNNCSVLVNNLDKHKGRSERTV